MAPRRKTSRNEKIFYAVSIIIVISMVLGTVAFVVAPF